jgi:trk system potassium uptake protein TrkA
VENKAEALEFIINEDSPVAGIPLSQLKIRDNVLIASIYRRGHVIMPNGQTTIAVGDSVVVVTTHRGFRDIRDILA